MIDFSTCTADDLQKLAADNSKSIWVDANAGSGKTTVLTNRILSILMDDTPPSRILCLTYTRVGASEMIARIHKKLMDWATKPETALRHDLAGLLNVAVADEHVTRARQLFARVLDTPGGLKITTIHSLCQGILKRFPVESGVPLGFDVADESTLLAVKRQAMDKTMQDVLASDKLFEHVNIINAQMDNHTVQKICHNMAGNPEKMTPIFAELEFSITAMHNTIGYSTENDYDTVVLQDFCNLQNRPKNHLFDLISALSAIPTDSAQNSKTAIEQWLSLDPENRAQNIDDYMNAFLSISSASCTIRSRGFSKLQKQPAWQLFEDEATNLIHLRDCHNITRTAKLTESLLRIGQIYVGHYTTIKHNRALLEFKDMEVATLNLLNNGHGHLWVLYKMDEGIDHVLVDEAQDTSPIGWQIIEKLTQSFFEQRPMDTDVRPRTVFAVGDYKQSIYSFQGASPREFIGMGDKIYQNLLTMHQGDDFMKIPMQTSFRSTHAILHYVDGVFATAGARAGVVLQDSDSNIHHHIHRPESGRVDIWPIVAKPAKATDDDDLLTPLQSTTRQVNAKWALAAEWAEWVKNTIGTVYLNTENRMAQPQDILFLVRSRGDFVEHLLRELRKQNIPVAGADRLKIRDHIAVQDMIAVCRFVLFPNDDLNLACVLKSPFIAMDEDGTEDALFQLSHPRAKGESLWLRLEKLANKTGHNSHYQHAYAWLKSLLNLADTIPPYELLCHVLNQPCALSYDNTMTGWQALHRRMGDDVDDPVVTLLQIAMDFELAGVTSMQRFVHHITAIDVEIKREMEQDINAVRIMTVHGAKGLESPMVIIPMATDTGNKGGGASTDFMWAENPKTNQQHPYYVRATTMPDCLKSTKQKIKEDTDKESARLLYVALTRASERLLISGIATNKPEKKTGNIPYKQNCWYDLCLRGLETINNTDHITVTEAPFQPYQQDINLHDDSGWVLQNPHQSESPRLSPQSQQSQHPPIPEWAYQTIQMDAPDARPLMPSRDDGDSHIVVKSPRHAVEGKGDGKADSNPYKRGILIHRLLESLPNLSPDKWDTVIDAYFAKQGDILDAEKSDYKTEILTVLRHPDLADLFTYSGQNGRAKSELPITGMIGKTPVTARVDRVLIDHDNKRIVIVDYKTRRHIPSHNSQIPAPYVRQLAIYRELLQSIYPNYDSDCYIVWTDGAVVMPLDKTMMDDHIKHIKSSEQNREQRTKNDKSTQY